MQQETWLFMTIAMVSQCLYFIPPVALLIAALIFRSRSRKASNFVIAGCLISLFSIVASLAINIALARSVGAAEFGRYVMFINIMSTTLHAIAMFMIGAGAFVDRDPTNKLVNAKQVPAPTGESPFQSPGTATR